MIDKLRFDKRIKKPKWLVSRYKKLKEDVVLEKIKIYITTKRDVVISENIVKDLKIRKEQVDKAILKLKIEGLLREKNYPSHDREYDGSGWHPTIYEIVRNK